MELVTPAVSQTNPVRTTFLLGVSTVIAQSILLREAMAAMGGSETAWGLVMALWMAGMGAGARAGVSFGTQRLATTLPVIVIVLAGLGSILLRAAPSIVGSAPGETMTTLVAVWLWTAAVVPAALAGGLAFPAVAESLGTQGPGRAYVLEACGALTGGLVLTFVLLRFGTAGALLVVMGLTIGATLWPYHRAVALVIAIGFVVLIGPAGDLLARATWTWAKRPGELGAWAETSHQRLEISRGPPFSLYTDGRLRSTTPDPFLAVPRAHLMMLLHPDPQRVLAIGATADGTVEAMTLHRPSEIILVDEDPHLPPLLRRWFGTDFRSSIDQPPVRQRPGDPIRAVARERGLDLILITDGDPTTIRANRTRTLEFFRQCKRSMAPDGIVVVELGVSDTYLGGDGGRFLSTLATTLRQVFPVIDAVPGDPVLLVASSGETALDTSLTALDQRLRHRPNVERTFPTGHLELLLDPARQPDLRAFIVHGQTESNTARYPRAVGFANRLHEARSRSLAAGLLREAESRAVTVLPWILAMVSVALLGTAIPQRLSIRPSAVAWVVGFSSMGWWLLLLAAWQTGRGSVYAEVGALTAAFMVGVAGGGWLGIRGHRPAHTLAWLLAAGVLISLAIAAGLPLRSPVPAVPVLLILGGGLTGAAFPCLASLAGGGSDRRGAGVAFAADEVGAATAALIIGTVAIPWVGMTATATGLAVLGAAGIPAALRR